MSLIAKLQTALGLVFLTSISAIGLAAQTQTATGSYPTSTTDTTNKPRKVEAARSSAASTENTAQLDKSAEVTGEKDAKVIRDASAPSSTTEPRSETESAPRPQPATADKWEFQISPYFWLASLHGTGGVGNRTTQVDESFSDIFHSLDFALMGVFEARKGKFVILTDMEYVAVSDDKATPGPFFSDVNAKFKTFIFNPEVGYRVFANPEKGQSIDVLGGIRVWHVSTELNFGAGILPATQVQGSRNWVDGLAGLRGKTALTPKLFVTGEFDLGGGGSNFTWHLFAGGGYNVTPKIALIGGYRVLDVNYNKDNFIYDMNQRGPIIGVGFKF